MQNDFIELLAIWPGMCSSKFLVRKDSWDHYCDHYMNFPDQGNCFLPCTDIEGDSLFMDMTKLLAFYVLTKPTVKKNKKSKKERS